MWPLRDWLRGLSVSGAWSHELAAEYRGMALVTRRYFPNTTVATTCSHHRANPTSPRTNSPTKKRGAREPKAKGSSSRNCRGLGIMGALCSEWALLGRSRCPCYQAAPTTRRAGAATSSTRRRWRQGKALTRSFPPMCRCVQHGQAPGIERRHPALHGFLRQQAKRESIEGLGRGSIGMNV